MRFLKYFEDNGWKSWSNTSPNNNIEEMQSVLSDLESLFIDIVGKWNLTKTKKFNIQDYMSLSFQASDWIGNQFFIESEIPEFVVKDHFSRKRCAVFVFHVFLKIDEQFWMDYDAPLVYPPKESLHRSILSLIDKGYPGFRKHIDEFESKSKSYCESNLLPVEIKSDIHPRETGNNMNGMKLCQVDIRFNIFEEPDYTPKPGWEVYEHFKVKNITEDDVINCVKNGGYVYASIIKDLPKNDPDKPLRAVSFEDGIITIEYDGMEYETDLKNIEKIDIPG